MAKPAGIKGSVTVKVADSVTVHEFTLPLDLKAVYDKGDSTAKFTVDTEPFKDALGKLRDWISAFPAELANG